MKKMNTTIAVLAMIIFILSIILTIKAYTIGINETGIQYYVVNNKFFGQPEELRWWITPNNPAIKKQAEELKDTSELGTVVKCYNFLADGYHYEEDDTVLLNSGHIILVGGQDFWQLPVMMLAQKQQNNGNTWCDCEDGTFFLVSLLRANGIKAKANIGTITITDDQGRSSIYGHAYATVEIDGKTYLLETTLGEHLTELRPVPNFYKASVSFDEKTLYVASGGDINKVITIYPPLPTSKITELKNLLKNSY